MTAEENPRGKGHVVSARNQYSKQERSMRLLFFISGSSSVSHRSFFGVHAFFWGWGLLFWAVFFLLGGLNSNQNYYRVK